MHSVLKDTYLAFFYIINKTIKQLFISFGRTHVILIIIKCGIVKHFSNTPKVMIKILGLVYCNDSTKCKRYSVRLPE